VDGGSPVAATISVKVCAAGDQIDDQLIDDQLFVVSRSR